jgi:hypothetical protein
VEPVMPAGNRRSRSRRTRGNPRIASMGKTPEATNDRPKMARNAGPRTTSRARFVPAAAANISRPQTTKFVV